MIMKTNNVKQIIKELARQNFSIYEEWVMEAFGEYVTEKLEA